MDGITVSQALSVAAPQLEVDKGAKAQSTSNSADINQGGAFVSLIQLSMTKVQEMLKTEKEDPILREEEEQNPED